MKLRIAIVAVAALSLAGCAPPGTYRKVRETIRTLAIRHLGPADRYDVSTSRDSLQRLQDGRIARVDIHGVNVRPGPGLILDEIFVSARNVKVDRGKRTVETAEETTARAYVTANSLAEMVDDEGTISDASVVIRPDQIVISGRYAVLGALPVSIVATGKARVVGVAGIEFVSDKVTAAGLPFPIPVTRSFDFATVYPALVISGVSTEEGRAVLTGTLDWSKLQNG
ncbi:MAG TPA: hypothetical protein VGM51_14055 [Armatimonadota bacterium]|jgi:hypothetical protein